MGESLLLYVGYEGLSGTVNWYSLEGQMGGGILRERTDGQGAGNECEIHLFHGILVFLVQEHTNIGKLPLSKNSHIIQIQTSLLADRLAPLPAATAVWGIRPISKGLYLSFGKPA